MGLYRPKGKDGFTSPFYYYDFTVNGTRYKGSTEKTSKPEAREVAAEKRKEVKSGRGSEQIKPIRFSEFAKEYLALHAATTRSKSFYEFTVRVLKRRFDDSLLTSIKPLDCAKFMADRRQDVKAATANASLIVLKHMFRMAEEWGYLAKESNPARSLKGKKPRNARSASLTPEARKEMLTEAADWFRPFLMYAMYTGGRRKECRLVDWQDVNLNTGKVTFRAENTKNGEARTVPAPPELAQALRSLPSRAKHGAVFERDGERISDKQVRTEFERIVRKVGRPGFRLHDLRHAWATDMAMAGVPMRTLMDLGGWKSLEMVQRYADSTPSSHAWAAQTMTRIFDSTRTTSAPLGEPQEAKGEDQSRPEDVEKKAGAEDRT